MSILFQKKDQGVDVNVASHYRRALSTTGEVLVVVLLKNFQWTEFKDVFRNGRHLSCYY